MLRHLFDSNVVKNLIEVVTVALDFGSDTCQVRIQ